MASDIEGKGSEGQEEGWTLMGKKNEGISEVKKMLEGRIGRGRFARRLNDSNK